MKQVGDYNKLPPSLKPKKLKTGEIAIYRLLSDSFDTNDPEKKKKLYPTAIKIPTLDVIRDPETGDSIEIGVVEKVDRDHVPTVKTFWVNGRDSNGYFSIGGGNHMDEYIQGYLEICNFNGSNPNRDESVKPMFIRIDRNADAKKELKEMDIELEALVYVRDMSVKELRNFAAAMNWDDREDVDILRKRAKDFAKKDPASFSRMATSKEVEVKALIKRANDTGAIHYSIAQHKVSWGNSKETIATLTREEGVDWLTQFSDWLKTGKNGEKTLEGIRKLMNEEEKSVTPTPKK